MRAYTKQNRLGYWVGCIEYDNGVHSEITNACYSEARAMEIVERLNRQWAQVVKEGRNRGYGQEHVRSLKVWP